MTRTVTTKAAVRESVSDARREGASIGLVPTMGALHEGHLSLVREARGQADFVVVSIFVNPTQFGPSDDYERYPRDLDSDVAQLQSVGADLVFAPAVDEVYAEGSQTSVVPGALAGRWEGEARPGHFEGVTTVVAKLFNIVAADFAFFGEKDYQQLRVIQQMALDLDFPVEVIGCPIVRDADGLALSSRNAYLSAADRERARAVPMALERAVEAAAAGTSDVVALEELMADTLRSADIALDYAALVDPETLEPAASLARPARALIAGRVGSTRMIDNRLVEPRV